MGTVCFSTLLHCVIGIPGPAGISSAVPVVTSAREVGAMAGLDVILCSLSLPGGALEP